MNVETIVTRDLPEDWRLHQGWTQRRGDEWHDRMAAPLLRVPSTVVPIAESPDINVLINHRHPRATDIEIAAAEPFVLDPRLF